MTNIDTKAPAAGSSPKFQALLEVTGDNPVSLGLFSSLRGAQRAAGRWELDDLTWKLRPTGGAEAPGRPRAGSGTAKAARYNIISPAESADAVPVTL